MSDSSPQWMAGISNVVKDPLKFKKKLNIGEDAYKSLKAKRYLLEALDAGTGAATGVGVATSPVVASTLFAPTGIAGLLGVGAATPEGWAVAAGAVGAGLSVALGKYFVRGSSNRVSIIPDFINTPLDLLAFHLIDFIGSLSFKVAAIDGVVHPKEVARMKEYFIDEWGYDKVFVSKALGEVRIRSKDLTIGEIATKLAEFKKDNEDCNYKVMSQEILEYLREIALADGFLDEREEMAIEKVGLIFEEVGSLSVSKAFDKLVLAVQDAFKKKKSISG